MKRLITVLLTAAALCSCSLRQPAVVTNDYALEVPSPARGPAGDKSIAVLPVAASPAAGGQMFSYRVDELRYERDFYNRLLAPPAQLLTGEFRKWLMKSKAGPVREPGSPLGSDLVVQPRLTGFYADYRDPQRPRAVVDMVIVLVAREPSGNRQVFERTYHGDAAMREISPAAAAGGWGRAAAEVFAAFTRDLRRAAP